MPQLPLDTSCRAIYEDGFVLDETEHNDLSPYEHYQDVCDYDDDGECIGTHPERVDRNILRAIIDRMPETEHGRMVSFAVFYKDKRSEIDWTTLPDNARPIRFRDGQSTYNTETGEETFCWTGCRMGYQYTDGNGRNVQEVRELE